MRVEGDPPLTGQPVTVVVVLGLRHGPVVHVYAGPVSDRIAYMLARRTEVQRDMRENGTRLHDAVRYVEGFGTFTIRHTEIQSL